MNNLRCGFQRILVEASCFTLVISLVSCATSSITADQQTPSASRASSAVLPSEIGRSGTDRDTEILENLWRSRMAPTSADVSRLDFPLGPGDVLRISVSQIDQLRERTVRVSEENTIALPLLGVINTAGMSEQDLRKDLIVRLTKYMYRPQVEVFLVHTESRQVAVLGSVKTPGRYMVTSRSDTIMTMISRAGGMTQEAASRVLLIPAAGDTHGGYLPQTDAQSTRAGAATASYVSDPQRVANPPIVDGDGSPALLLKTTPSEAFAKQIEMGSAVIHLSRAENQRFLELPVRCGDVIIVPAAGEVTVQGWVDKPGSFKITPGMTALSSIAAAGGALFTTSATLLREQSDGGKLEFPLDLPRIKNGEEADVAVQGGDVIVVERSVVGAVPYSLYYIVTHIGIGLPIPF